MENQEITWNQFKLWISENINQLEAEFDYPDSVEFYCIQYAQWIEWKNKNQIQSFNSWNKSLHTFINNKIEKRKNIYLPKI